MTLDLDVPGAQGDDAVEVLGEGAGRRQGAGISKALPAGPIPCLLLPQRSTPRLTPALLPPVSSLLLDLFHEVLGNAQVQCRFLLLCEASVVCGYPSLKQ